MYCKYCGTENADTSKFCMECGKPLRAAVPKPEAGESRQKPYGQNDYEQGTPQPNPYQQSGYGQSGAQANPYSQNGYGQMNGAPDGYGMGVPKKKKSKKPLVITLVIVILAALIGGFVFLGIRAGSTSAPIKQFESSMKNGDWGKLYDSIYWGSDMDNYQTKSEFVDSMDESVSSLVSMISTLSSMKFEVQDEGLSYTGSDGLTRKDVTVTISVSIFGTNQEENVDLTLVKAGKKFGLFPTWKIDASSMGEFF